MIFPGLILHSLPRPFVTYSFVGNIKGGVKEGMEWNGMEWNGEKGITGMYACSIGTCSDTGKGTLEHHPHATRLG